MKDHMGILNFSLLMSWNLVIMGSSQSTFTSTSGITNLFSITSFQSTPQNQGWARMESASCSNPSLFSGFWARRRLMRSLNFSGVFLENLTIPFLTISQSYLFVSALQGGHPTQSQQSTTPNQYQSTMRLCPRLLMIQRGRQAGVPQKDLLRESMSSVFLERPKSVRRAWPYWSSTMLSGFRSRQIMLYLWRAYTPRRISQAQFFTYCQVNLLRLCSSLERSPPSQQSITRNRYVSVWKAQRNLTTKGWSTRLRISLSVWMYLQRLVPQTLSFLMALRAYNLSSSPSLRTRQTSPKAPSPIFLQKMKEERVMASIFWLDCTNWQSLKMFFLRQNCASLFTRFSLPSAKRSQKEGCCFFGEALLGEETSSQLLPCFSSIFSIILRWLPLFLQISSSTSSFSEPLGRQFQKRSAS